MSYRGPIGRVTSPARFAEVDIAGERLTRGMVVALSPTDNPADMRAGLAHVEAVDKFGTRFASNLDCAIPAALEGDKVFEYVDDAAEEAKQLRETVLLLRERVSLLERRVMLLEGANPRSR